MTPPGDAPFVGLISGTSMDAVDAVVVDLAGHHPPALLASLSHPIPEALRAGLRHLADPQTAATVDELGTMDAQVGELFADAALHVISAAGLEPAAIVAIGSHGQTVRHRPDADPAFTLQIGNPQRIAQRTGITTVADFRQRDMAAGGQGAPLVPAFHRAVFAAPEEDRAVINIGGIANLTHLPARGPITGFDTGPGNTLMDHWIRRHRHLPYDDQGDWARQGRVSKALLDALMSDAYLRQPPPKSTGPEHFSPAWLDAILSRVKEHLAPHDVQRTLLEFTAQSVAAALASHTGPGARALVCGGGARNRLLMERLAALMPERSVSDSGDFGVDPDWVEAAAFAWLARETLAGRPGNIPEVTGAREAVVLGGIYPGRCQIQDAGHKK
jgi:anhydro-N-acetylmuramic acid kinase